MWWEYHQKIEQDMTLESASCKRYSIEDRQKYYRQTSNQARFLSVWLFSFIGKSRITIGNGGLDLKYIRVNLNLVFFGSCWVGLSTLKYILFPHFPGPVALLQSYLELDRNSRFCWIGLFSCYSTNVAPFSAIFKKTFHRIS